MTYKKEVEGTVERAKGALKETLGAMTNQEDLEARGEAQKAEGAAQEQGVAKADDKPPHEAHAQSNAPYGKEEHMNEELAKQREGERQPS